jgi:inhibitor of KinA
LLSLASLTKANHYPSIHALGDNAITITLGDTIDEKANAHVHALCQFLHAQKIIGIQDIIPAYASLTVVYDLWTIHKQMANVDAHAYFQQLLMNANEAIKNTIATVGRKLQIPVCYDPTLGIDLDEIAITKKMSVEEIIEKHTRKTYRVFMLGFQPGFAYMGTVDERIAMPRKSMPRNNIAAGSVGIAGFQTGIYPFDSPGGWNIVGRTPLRLFDVNKNAPCLFQPNDEVQFMPISLAEFHQIQSAQ